MFRSIYVSLIICLVLSNANAFAQSSKEPIEMPEGFEGIYLGMSIEDFLKIRPNANVNPMQIYSEDQKVDITKPNQTLEEFIENDPLFGMLMLGTYTLKDRKLKDMLLIWSSEDIKQIRKHRGAFISSSIKRWGPNFQRMAMKQEPGTDREHLVPLFVWQKQDIMIAASYTPKYNENSLGYGAFSINILSKSEFETLIAYAGYKTDPATLKRLFEDVEKY